MLRSGLQLVKGHVLIRVDDRGAAYPLRIDPLIQQAELTGSDGAAGDLFGDSVAISGNTMAVGAPHHKVGSNTEQGAVYVFTMPTSGWAGATQTAELTASDGAEDDLLGWSVAISGDTVIAGAPSHAVKGGRGAAYVFTMPVSGWRNAPQTAELTDSSAGANDFGWSVAVAGETAVVGAPFNTVEGNFEQGAIYEFTMPAAGWADMTQTAELTAAGGVKDDHLGYSVAVAGETIVAGAPIHKVGSNNLQGIAYVYTMPALGWEDATQNAELTASDGGERDGFGGAIAVSGDTVVVGATGHKVGANPEQGAVYEYTMPTSGWINAPHQTAELTASDGAIASLLLGLYDDDGLPR